MDRQNHRIGNKNAAKPKDQKRVTLSVRVDPSTLAALNFLAKGYGSVGRAIDAIVAGLPDRLPGNKARSDPQRPAKAGSVRA